MDNHSSTQSFPSLNLHRHRPAFHLTLPNLLSPETLYTSSQPVLDSFEQYGSRGEDSTTSFPTSSTSSGERKGSGGADVGFLNTSGSNLDGDVSHLGHLDGNSRLGSHFAETWYGASKKEEVWEDGESCESAAGEFYGKGDYYRNANDVFYAVDYSSEDGARRKLRANYNNYGQVGCEAKSETVFNREANDSRFNKQTTSCSRSAEGSFSDSSVDYCRTDSRVSANYLGREEEYRCSNGSGEDQLLLAEVEGPWLSISPSIQTGEGRWRGAAGTHTLVSGGLPQRSSVSNSSGTYTQKLDSFSEAFLTQRKRRFPVIPSGDSSGQLREFEVGRGESHGLVKSRHSCAFDSDSYLPPSSSSPSHPSFLSFPSPPTSSHLMSSVLSPPPTPLPPPSHSPSKMDSPSAFGAAGHSVSQGGESLGTLQVLPSRLQSLSVHNSGMLWKFPLLSHNFSQSSGEPSSSESDLISSHGDDYATTTAPHNIIQSPESSLITSSSHRSSHRAPCPSNAPSLHPSVHLPSRPSHFSSQHYEDVEKIASYLVTHKVKNGPANQKQAQPQKQFSSVYNGTSFPSTLHSSRGHKRHHYTPRPLLNPVRRGTGLYSSISYSHYRGDETGYGEEEEECEALPYVNVGYEFQAELPPCFVDGKGSGGWSSGEESPREQLLWKPWDELEESAKFTQVQKLLSMCSSSCLPGGGSNTELALHCLHYCQGNTMATLEMLLFSQPLPTRDYHYSGSDFWTDIEKGHFSAALGTYGKDFSVIQKTVRTKTKGQCVEFYYLSKKLVDKQKKLKEEENRDGELEQQKSVTPLCQPMDRQFGFEEAVPVPSLASFFPCKLCGKMFYKIKSRNAHMKIHRQPQEDWTDRRLQHQLLTQRLALSRPSNLIPTPGSNLLLPQTPAMAFSSSGLSGTSGNNADNVLNSVPRSNSISPSDASVLDPSTAVAFSNIGASNTHVITSIDADDSGQRQPTTVLPLHQSWGAFEHSQDPAAYYCNTEGKQHVRAGTVGGKEPINWQ
ncbi:transcriptional-regulating factor 1-like [Mastacembelus armatus]|uniref:Transcriptional-regulating factor 1-like n=1 Tax=Mastacembelus armatus TaxID=205130 RepID=A0A3Q3LJ22_9TELE|nr:transcriptional-regulating factor 1-like [Mastacembelus armatus]XP_026154145.1 transcriptional-regulating factor 1-like [Mastacembelus armatus]